MNKNNDKILSIRVRQEELRMLEDAAQKQGRTSLSAFIRQASLAAAQKIFTTETIHNSAESSFTSANR